MGSMVISSATRKSVSGLPVIGSIMSGSSRLG